MLHRHGKTAGSKHFKLQRLENVFVEFLIQNLSSVKIEGQKIGYSKFEELNSEAKKNADTVFGL